MDPHYVIRRYETGKFAINNSIRRVYQEALTLSGHFYNLSNKTTSRSQNILKGKFF